MISDVIAAHMRDLRGREGISREELAQRARAAGAPESFTPAVVGFLETGRVRSGRRTREFSLDEVVWIATALQVQPIALFGDGAAEFFGALDPVACPRCGGQEHEIERATRQALESLQDLVQLEPALAAGARRLAREADRADPDHLPRLVKEWRSTLEVITAARRAEPDPDEDDELGDDLGEPAGGDVDLSGIDASALDQPDMPGSPDADELGP